MKVLSLFDGMACGMIAMQLAGVDVESYDAYEIDKYAIKTAQHNFPMIKEHGDVFSADFTQYEGVDFLIGGSPCTYWSIAQTKNRETVASGMGWELFSQYVRALHEAKPKYFIYENNKSMSKDIRASIDKAFGFEAVLINSALVSAQNRQRLYWVGRRNEDGTYSKVNVEQPADRGILLKDVLDGAVAMREKAHTIDANYYNGGNFSSPDKQSGKRLMAAEPINVTEDGKSQTLKAQYCKNSVANFCCYSSTYGASGVAEPVNITQDHGCAEVLNVNPCGHGMNGAVIHCDGKCRTLTTNKGEGPKIIEPAFLRYERTDEAKRCRKAYEAHEIKHGYNELNELHPRPDGKTNTLTTVLKDNQIMVPIPTIGKAGKEITIYEVKDGKITIKGKQYPIKLKDGYYIIRKLTVSECKRLQTVPEWYEFPVSNSQAYKMLGNGWTCEVIAHLIRSCYGRIMGVME